jgi:hypothetical protein
MKMRKFMLVSMLIVLLCSINVSVVFADGDAPPPDSLSWSDATNDSGTQVDMSGLQATESQVSINTGNGGDTYAGGQGSQTVTETVTSYTSPDKAGTFIVMSDIAAANAYRNPEIQATIDASQGAMVTSSALTASQAQSGRGWIDQHAAPTGSTDGSGLSLSFISTNTLQNNDTTYGYDMYANTGAIYTPQGSNYDAALANAIANNVTGINMHNNTGFASNNSQTTYTGQWNLFNSIDVGIMKTSAGVQALLGNTSAVTITQSGINAYQTQHNFGSNNLSLGQQVLNALNPKNLINAVQNLTSTGTLGGKPTTYDRYISPGTFGNQMAAAQQQLAISGLNATGGTTILFFPSGADLSAFGFPPPGGGTPVPGGPTPPPFIWIPVYPPVPTCSYYAIIPGSIGAIARHTAPPNPVVLGQDDQKRGVDLWWELTIGPTIEEWETLEVTGYGQQCNPLNPNDCVIYEEYGCEMHRNYYCEPIAEATATATLSATSKAWILEELSYKYPGATLKNPGLGYSEPAIGRCAGTTYVWTIEKEEVPVEDPGNWDLSIIGRTRGTPVSGGRNFNVAGGRFPAYLIDTTIIK